MVHAQPGMYEVSKIPLPARVSVRALQVIDDSTVWIGASNGIYACTRNGGKTWIVDSVWQKNRALDFRSIYAFDATTCIFINAGSPAFIYKVKLMQTDDGKFMSEQELNYMNAKPEIFFDAMAFNARQIGYAIADPVDNKFIIIRSEDAGKHWNTITTPGIEAIKGEALFAASNTSLVTADSIIAFVTGGSQSRICYSTNDGATWNHKKTTLIAGSEMQGAFTMDMNNEVCIVAGGDYNDKDVLCKNIVLLDVKNNFQNLPLTNTLRKFISCIQLKPGSDSVIVAACQPGLYITYNQCATWQKIDDGLYHTVRWGPDGKILYAAGKDGIVVRIQEN